MEVLTAYVRENSRRDHEKPSTPASVSNEDSEENQGAERAEELSVRRPPTDIQAVLNVLTRREEDRVPDQHRVRLDLQEGNLQGASLRGANFQRANLQGANLLTADLQRADLQAANLRGADFERAELQDAYFQDANLLERFAMILTR